MGRANSTYGYFFDIVDPSGVPVISAIDWATHLKIRIDRASTAKFLRQDCVDVFG